MPENLNNFENTSDSQVPPLPEQVEITSADIEEANTDSIAIAIYDDIDRLNQRKAYTTSPAEQKDMRQRIIEATSAERALNNWDESETFGEFVEKSASAEDAPQWASEADNWLSRSGHLIGDVLRVKLEEAVASGAYQPNRQVETPQPVDPEVAARKQAEQQSAVENARASVERARSAEIFDDVVKLGKNKTHLHTDILGSHGVGLQNIGDALDKHESLWSFPGRIMQEAGNNPDWHKHLNEAVAFTDVVDVNTQDVTRSRTEKGRLGRTHTTEYTSTEEVPGSEHPKLIRNELTGQDEPAVRFRYRFQFSQLAGLLQGKELPNYQEFQGGRNGQIVAVGMELPKSVADKLRAQIGVDPTSVRSLAERLFLENSDGTMTSEYWNEGGKVKHPIRPPYEKLPEDWTLAVVDGHEAQQASGRYSVQPGYVTEQLPVIR